jgi:hypothetical protein
VSQSPCRRRGRRSSPHCCKSLRTNDELLVRQSPDSKEVNTETDEASVLQGVTRQHVKRQKTEKI